MSGTLRNNGALIPTYKTLSGATAETIFTGVKGGAVLNELQVSNGTGAGVTVVVDVHDGTNVLYELDPGKIITTTGKLDFSGIPLPQGHSIRVTGASGVGVALFYYRGTYEGKGDKGAASLGRMGASFPVMPQRGGVV